MKKRCTKCRQSKSHDCFSTNKASKDGKHYYCKECCALLMKQYRTNNPIREYNEHSKATRAAYAQSEKGKEVTRRSHLKLTYNITLEEYNAMVIDHGDCCAICGTTNNGKRRVWCVDHDHNTNKVRGLLCTNCNSALGKFKDNKEVLNNAIKYLKQYEQFVNF